MGIKRGGRNRRWRGGAGRQGREGKQRGNHKLLIMVDKIE